MFKTKFQDAQHVDLESGIATARIEDIEHSDSKQTPLLEGRRGKPFSSIVSVVIMMRDVVA